MQVDLLAQIIQKGFFLIGWIGCIFSQRTAETKDFEKRGHVFPIQEESLLEIIQKIPPMTPDKYLDQLLQKAQHPKGVISPKPAETQRSYFIDPSFTATDDIKTPKGAYIVRKGSRINPLRTLTLSSSLVFLDGSKEEQIEWASQQKGNNKWILVKGDPLFLEEKYQRPIYFDQNGYYSRKFQIQHFPAMVTQAGQRLKITEIPLKQGRGG